MFSKFMQGKLIPDFWVCSKENLLREVSFEKNKPKGLKVAKEDQRLIGSMVNRLDG